jgi:hypothetical protein
MENTVRNILVLIVLAELALLLALVLVWALTWWILAARGRRPGLPGVPPRSGRHLVSPSSRAARRAPSGRARLTLGVEP